MFTRLGICTVHDAAKAGFQVSADDPLSAEPTSDGADSFDLFEFEDEPGLRASGG